jgi:hypothetical protein
MEDNGKFPVISKFAVATDRSESIMVIDISTNTEIARGSFEEMQALCTRLNETFPGHPDDFENWKFNPDAPILIGPPITMEEYKKLPHICELEKYGIKVPKDLDL